MQQILDRRLGTLVNAEDATERLDRRVQPLLQ